MPTIKVNTTQLGRYESDLQGILSRVNSIMNQFDSVSRNLDWDVKAESNINSRLSAISRDLSAESRGINGMKNYLGTAVTKYNNVESKNSGRKLKNETTGRGTSVYIRTKKRTVKDTKGLEYQSGYYGWRSIDPKQFANSKFPWKNGAYLVHGQPVIQGTATTAMTEGFWGALKSFLEGNFSNKESGSVYETKSKSGESFFKVLTGAASASFKPGKYVKYSDKKAISDSINDLSKFLTGENALPKQEKITKKQINPDESWYSQKGTIAEVKAEVKIDGSVIDAKASGESKYAQGSVEAKVLTGEAHASANAGLYIYEKGTDGEVKRIVSPSVLAEVGTSVALLDLIAEGRVGLGENNNMLGAYGKAEVKAESAEAKAKVSLNRKEVYAGVSAEADLVKAEATGGVSVLGTDIGVSGAVKVGVGAHAEVGYTDGKLKVDVGAAVGVGVDIGFEVDISGTVDAVAGWAESAWDKVKWW